MDVVGPRATTKKWLRKSNTRKYLIQKKAGKEKQKEKNTWDSQKRKKMAAVNPTTLI